nr:hypothetical protein [Acinetobacter sp.]
MICDLIHFIANIFIGFLNFIKMIDILQILKFSLLVIPIYVFVQRVHSQTQQRAFKAVSDEIVKINDFVIEFIFKIEIIEPDTEIDAKTISELQILKNKINAHIIYTHEYINGYPYGGPLNYVCFFVFKRYLFLEPKNDTDELELMYQELILNDTILSLEKEFIEDKKLKPLDDYTRKFNQVAIDNIVSISRAILEHLEDNTRKML